MKKSFIALMAMLSLFSLTSCNTNNGGTDTGNTSNTQKPATPSYRLKNVNVEAGEDFVYNISFKTNKEVAEVNAKYYISENNKYDSKDKEFTPTISGTSYTFKYDGDLLDFYILIVEDSTQVGRTEVILPSMNLDIIAGEGEEKDVINFDFLNNTNQNLGALTIYGSATKSKENGQVIKELDSVDTTTSSVKATKGMNYFWYVTASGFTSQFFELGKQYGNDLVSISSASITEGGKLTVSGKILGSQDKTYLTLSSNEQDNLAKVELTKGADGSFQGEYDLSLLSGQGEYNVYFNFGGGFFSTVKLNDVNEKKITSDRIYSLNTNGEDLVLSFADRAAINILNSKLEMIDNKPYFTVEGVYDADKIEVEEGEEKIKDPLIVVSNAQNGFYDKVTGSLTLNEENHTFEGKVDLSVINSKKLGAWLDVKIWMNSEAKESTGEDETIDDNYSPFKWAATYEFKKTEVEDYDARIIDADNQRQYYFQSYNGFLKIVAIDASFSLETAYLSREGNSFYFNLKGNVYKNVDYVVAVRNAGDSTDVFTGDIVRDEATNTYAAKVDVTNIKAATEYGIFIIDRGNGNNQIAEVESTNLVDKSHMKESFGDDNGAYYSFTTASWGSTTWWKLNKDETQGDKARVYGFDFTDGKLNMKGAILSTITGETAIAFADRDTLTTDNELGTPVGYMPLTVDTTTHTFTGSIDMSIFTEAKQYRALLVSKKEDGTYEKLGELYGTWMPDGAANIIGEANGFSFHFDSSESNGWKITLIGE